MLGLGANMLLFFAMFVLLAEPHDAAALAVVGRAPRRGRLRGPQAALDVLLRSTQGNPAFQAFGIALILLVWINYFSRVVLYAAAWAHTSRAARAARVEPVAAPVEGPPSPPLRRRRSGLEHPWAASYAAGAATMLGLVAVVRRHPPRPEGLMKLERKHGWLLVAIAVWNFVVWARSSRTSRRPRNGGEDRTTGYYVAHSVLIVVDIAIGVVLGLLGLRSPQDPRMRVGAASPRSG